MLGIMPEQIRLSAEGRQTWSCMGNPSMGVAVAAWLQPSVHSIGA